MVNENIDKVRGQVEQAEDGRFLDKYSNEDVLRVVLETFPEPSTAVEIAGEIGSSRGTSNNRLWELEDEGLVQTKRTGARARAWWPTPAEFLDELQLAETAWDYDSSIPDADVDDVPDGRAVMEAVIGNFPAPSTSVEVGEAIGYTRHTADDRLWELVERGKIRTKKISARGRVWWPDPDEYAEELQARLEAAAADATPGDEATAPTNG